MVSKKKKSNTSTDLLERFRHVKNDGLLEFDNSDKPLEMGLRVLWVAKEKFDVRMLTAYEIADVIVNVMENSIDARAIVNAFNGTKGKKIHIRDIDGKTYYEIMGPGKEHLIKKTGEGSIAVYYFEPGKRYQSKSVLATNILADLKGVLKIVDPYGDTGTLDILSKANVEDVQFLIRLDSLSEQNKRRFQRELQDFKSDHPNIKFRNYSQSEIHDRYIISIDKLIILGHSLKDLGSKESFAIKLDKQTAGDIFDTLIGTFNRRWKEASQL